MWPGDSAPANEASDGWLASTSIVNDEAAPPPTTCLMTVIRGAMSLLVIVQVAVAPGARLPSQPALRDSV